MVRSRLLKDLAALAVLAAVYFAAGKLGLKLAFVNASATAVWPCTGIALAAFLILGYRVWPAILAGAFLVNWTTAGSVATSLGISTGNTLEGVVGCYLSLALPSAGKPLNGRRTFSNLPSLPAWSAPPSARLSASPPWHWPDSPVGLSTAPSGQRGGSGTQSALWLSLPY